jgi:hypothetical protein
MMFNFSCGISFGFCSPFSFGLLLPVRLLLLLLSLITDTEFSAWTRLEMLGILCACDDAVPFSFGDAGLGADDGVLFCELL